MKKFKNIFIIFLGLFFIGIVINIIFYIKDTKIDRVLKTSSYSYLPESAQNYIKEVYEETGELILTEKNKVQEQAYLNPDYVEYLETGEASEYGYIPEKYTIDHYYDNDTLEETSNWKTLLSYYNLRDEGYITNIYNQGEEGICWAFATSTSLESHIAIESNKNKMLTFSEKQVDYATTDAKNSVDIGKNPYLYSSSIIGETLNAGGNVLRYANAASIGISPVLCDGECDSDSNYNDDDHITSDKYWKYDYDYDSLISPYEVWNNDNVEYSIDEFLFYPSLTNNSQSNVDSMVSLMKEQIVNNGSLFAAIGAYTNLILQYSPENGETALNSNGKNMIIYFPYEWNSISASMNHAVSIIGWDDNYTHNICIDSTNVMLTNALYNGSNYYCSTGSLYTINGAWIIQNSWGDNSTFIYLPYNSMKSSYNSISKVSEVDYDNSYRITSSNNSFTKGNTKELVNKIKFYVNGYNQTIKVFYNDNSIILSSNSSYNGSNLIESVTYTQPGLYTIDLSSDNIIFDENTSKINLLVYGSILRYDYYMSLHTSNVNDDKYIKLNSISKLDESFLEKCTLNDNKCISEEHSLSFNDNNTFLVSGITRNLLSSDNLIFKIFNSNGDDVSSLFHIFRNFSVSNYINTIISYDSNNISLGNYIIKVYYNDILYDEYDWNLSKHNNILSGLGTYLNPYLIKTSTDLNNIRNITTEDKYFKLNNDIDLTYDTGNSNGLFYNSGLGWEPINFSGNFDGDNHVISGLYINRPKTASSSPSGLFGKIYGNGSVIQNIIIKNANITGNYDAGILAGKVYADNGIEINNISVIGGKVVSSYYNGGIIGGVTISNSIDTDTYCILYNLYSNTVVGSTDTVFSGGIIGVTESHDRLLSILLKDSINYSRVNGKVLSESGYPSTGGIIGIASLIDSITIKNVISAGSYDTLDDIRLGDIFGYVHDTNELNITNSYYINNIYGNILDVDSNYISNNYEVTYNNILNNNYINTFDYSSYWTYPVIDNIKRTPMLSSLIDVFEFTDSEDTINLSLGETKNIFDVISPNTGNAKNVIFTYDDEYLTINDNGDITPIKKGNTSIHISSLYDGYTSDIEAIILNTKTITFMSNNTKNEIKTQVEEYNTVINLYKNTFVSNGYVFKCWNTKVDGTGTSYNDEDEITITKDIALYAIWEKETYSVIFNSNGGTGTMSNQTYKYEESQKLTKNSYSKTGYKFKNWNTKEDGTGINYSDGEDTTITKNITLYAIWEKETYTVIFNSNGGTGTMSNQTYKYEESQKITKNSYSKTGYKFNGWNTKEDGTGINYSDEEEISIAENITLYAIWEKETYTVIFNSNGGTGTMSNQIFTYGVSLKLSDVLFTRDRYTFRNWNTKADGTGTSYSNKEEITIIKDMTLYAQWSEYVPYIINVYSYDKDNNYISNINVNTTVTEYKNNISLLDGYTIDVDYKVVDNKNVLYTGSKTRLYKNKTLVTEFTNIVNGDVNGDGKIGYIDYVNVYNHIQKTKHPESNKKLLDNEKLIAADMNNDSKISYLDYVKIYKKIKELKEENN